MLRAGKLVDERAPGVHIAQCLEPRERGQHWMTWNEIAQAIEIRPGHEVVEDVDHHSGITGTGVRDADGKQSQRAGSAATPI
jgi:hypothetical protein